MERLDATRKKNPEKIYEVDLYEPLVKFFTKQGYVVKGEVKHCDLTAVKDDELVIVELKRHLSVELLVQATKRQRLTEFVYIAIPKPKFSLFSRKWQDICHLVRRLECGLLLVSLQKGGMVTEVFPPAAFDRVKSMQRNKQKRQRVLREIEGRYGDFNVGGSSQTKIMTAYKENSLQIAFWLDRLGPSSPKMLRQSGTGEKTQSILQNNYDGWFVKVRRGVYGISERGKQALAEYPELAEHYRQLAEETGSATAT